MLINRLVHKNVAENLIRTIQASSYSSVYEYEKHRIAILDKAGDELFHIRLPITLPPPFSESLKEDPQVNYIILLIQSGNCAMGYFEDGINLDHKVFRAYMVRKKQGKSQIKHLKTKGKSRAGSRVRLGETVEFFENINERLQEYFQEHEIHRIAISCSKTLIPFLYNSKVSTPFDKKDERLYKIPRHIHTPIYDVMMDTHNFLLKGELIYQETQQELVNQLLGQNFDLQEEED